MTRPGNGEDPREFGDGEPGPAFDSPPIDTLVAAGSIRASDSTTLEERERLYAAVREILTLRYAAAVNYERVRLSAETPHLPPIEMDDELDRALE